MSHPRMLDRSQSVLVVIDVQEAYRGKTVEHDRMVRGVRRLTMVPAACFADIVCAAFGTIWESRTAVQR